MNNKKIFRIKPIFEERMWGGTQLIEKYNLETDLTKIAEIYSVIAIPGHLDCVVEGTDEFLSDFYHNHPNVFKCDAIDLPVRVVLGSSKAPLSVQIHPDDDYGLTHSNMRGKHEGELLLSGHEGNYMILGHYAKTREEFIRLAEEERWDELLRKVEVKPYDYIHIPYNTLHGSVGEGTCVAFSTNGDVTYRLYDYDRIDPKTGQKRQLHKQDVYNNVICPCNNIGPVDYITKEENGCRLNCFFDEPGLYTAGRITVEKVGFFKRKEFMFITCLSGKGTIEGLTIKGAETLLIPADYGELCIKGKVELVYITSRNR